MGVLLSKSISTAVLSCASDFELSKPKIQSQKRPFYRVPALRFSQVSRLLAVPRVKSAEFHCKLDKSTRLGPKKLGDSGASLRKTSKFEAGWAGGLKNSQTGRSENGTAGEFVSTAGPTAHLCSVSQASAPEKHFSRLKLPLKCGAPRVFRSK